MKLDIKDASFALGVVLAGVGLWLIHPKALFVGMAVLGVLLVRRSGF